LLLLLLLLLHVPMLAAAKPILLIGARK